MYRAVIAAELWPICLTKYGGIHSGEFPSSVTSMTKGVHSSLWKIKSL